MMLRTALTATLFLALTNPAKADKFYFESEEATAATQGNDKARMIEGVLLSETKDTYTIRIVGGEMEVAKSLVIRRVTNAMTVAQIENTEQGQAEALARAETHRHEIHAAEASARRTAPAAKSSADEPRHLLIEVDFQGLLPGYTFRSHDPVLHRANLSGLRQVIEDYLRRQVKTAAHR